MKFPMKTLSNVMGKKIKSKIPEPSLPNDKYIKFSFRFYDVNNKNYCLSCWEQDKILEAIKRLKEINNKTINELFAQKDFYKFHEVDWAQTIKKDGFPDKNANTLSPYQFGLPGVNGQKTRVFGGFSEQVFYIVWFDFNHEIWPVGKKHT